MKKIDKRMIIFAIGIIVISIFRFLLVCDLPVLANAILGADDALMVFQASTLIKGQWLGPYNGSTLLKGVSFPIFLAICYFCNIRFISAITILYIIACLTTILVIRKFIKNKLILFLIYTLLLFNPIMFGTEIMQRVYRSSIIPPLALFLIAGYINLFLLRNDENKRIEKVFTIIGISIALPFMWFAREDSIWIIPYIIFITISIFISEIVKYKKFNKHMIKTFVVLLIPIVVTCVVGNYISYKNYKFYGTYTVNNKYYYNKALKSMKKVKANEEIERVSFTREKLDRIAEVTILGNIMNDFNPLLDGYAKFDGNQQDNQVENGWFGFPLRDALSAAGYYKSTKISNNFYNTLHIEIEEALESGKLEKEDKNKYDFNFIKNLFSTIGECIIYVLTYDEVALDVTVSRDYNGNLCDIFDSYAEITRNKFIYTEDKNVSKEDAIIDYDEQREYLKSIEDENNIINGIIEFYKKTTVPLFVLACISYLYSTIKLIMTIKSKAFYNIENWVITSGFLGAAFTIICGIALETVLNANVISDLYLCGAYPLILAFTLISVYNGGVEIYKKIKNI